MTGTISFLLMTLYQGREFFQDYFILPSYSYICLSITSICDLISTKVSPILVQTDPFSSLLTLVKSLVN